MKLEYCPTNNENLFVDFRLPSAYNFLLYTLWTSGNNFQRYTYDTPLFFSLCQPLAFGSISYFFALAVQYSQIATARINMIPTEMLK